MADKQWRPAPPELERAVDEALGLQAISIRLPRELIDRYKAMAKERGIGYQPLMREVLIDGVGSSRREGVPPSAASASSSETGQQENGNG